MSFGLRKKEPLVVIDEDFLSELSALSPEYSKIKNLFEKVVHDKNQRQYIIFLALLNKRINSIISSLEQIEAQEELNKSKYKDDLPDRLIELNSEFTRSLNEFKSIGKDLLNSDYYKDLLKFYFKEENEKYHSARIYNKYDLPLPQRMTAFSDGYDIVLPMDVVLMKNTPVVVDTGFIIEPPQGYHIEIQIRSSLAKKGISMPTGVGIIDSDYCGKEDFIKFIFLYCGSNDSISLGKGERVAQLRFLKNTPNVEFLPIKVNELKNTTRGGLGSTN